jgi:hypothetical protein
MRSAWLTRPARSVPASRSPTPARALAGSSSVWAPSGWPAWPSNAATVRWWKPCWRPTCAWWWSPRGRSRACPAGIGPAGPGPIPPTPTCWLMCWAPTATAWPRSPQPASRPRSCGRCRAPPRTWSRPGSRWSTSSPASWKAAFPAPSGCLHELHSPTAVAFGCRSPTSHAAAALTQATLAGFLGRLHYSGRTPVSELLRRPSGRPSSRDQPGRGGRPGGLRAGSAGRHPGHQPPGTRAGSRDHRAPGAPRRPAQLHQPAPGRPPGPGGGAAGRARRGARPLPHRGRPGRPGWGRAGHHHLGQTPGREVPLGLRQAATGGPARLRR